MYAHYGRIAGHHPYIERVYRPSHTGHVNVIQTQRIFHEGLNTCRLLQKRLQISAHLGT